MDIRYKPLPGNNMRRLRFRVYKESGRYNWTLFIKVGNSVEYLDYGKEKTKRDAEDAAIRAIRYLIRD